MLNRVVLMGRLTADPELRQTPNNISVVTFTLAVERTYQADRNNRQADFINIVAWRSTAEFVSKYFVKGQLVAVEGSIQTRNYEDKNGNKRTAFEVVADQVFFAEAKRDGAAKPTATFNPPQFQEPEQGSNFSLGNLGDFVDLDTDDELPF